MFEKKYFSAHEDFKTGKLSKLSFIIGFILLIFFIFLKISSIVISEDSTGVLRSIYDFSISGVPDSTIAFSILFIGLGIIFYILYSQFAKLSKIAEEIENSEEFLEEIEKH